MEAIRHPPSARLDDFQAHAQVVMRMDKDNTKRMDQLKHDLQAAGVINATLDHIPVARREDVRSQQGIQESTEEAFARGSEYGRYARDMEAARAGYSNYRAHINNPVRESSDRPRWFKNMEPRNQKANANQEWAPCS